MSGNEDNKKSFKDKLTEFWHENRTLCIVVGFLAVAIIIGVIIYFTVIKKEKFGTKKKKHDMENENLSKEGFVSLNDVTENSYVNSYIESTRGEWEEV